LPKKSIGILKKYLEILKEDPYPGGRGDKKRLRGIDIDGAVYRMHVGRSYTLFYKVEKDRVKILSISTIEEAHKKYGRL
jgi:mRNA-degrading endonuclease RelE of RelBE toxin-antitoxin system